MLETQLREIEDKHARHILPLHLHLDEIVFFGYKTVKKSLLAQMLQCLLDYHANDNLLLFNYGSKPEKPLCLAFISPIKVSERLDVRARRGRK